MLNFLRMVEITETSNRNHFLIEVDEICDHIPGISSVTNLVVICLKLSLMSDDNKIANKNHYFVYIKEKSLLRCLILLVPVLGNVLIYIYDNFSETEGEEKTPETENEEKIPEILPPTPPTPAQIMEIEEMLGKLKQYILMSNKVTALPSCLTPNSNLKRIGSFYKGDLLEEILTSNITFNNTVLDKETQEKVNEISMLKALIILKWEVTYKGHIRTMPKETLFREAQKYYTISCKYDPQISPKQLNHSNFLEILQERCDALSRNQYATIEMRAIIERFNVKRPIPNDF